METKAILRGVRLSAQKGRLVADLVRGKSVEQALNILAFSPKRGAKIIRKVVESAIANAEHNDGADIDALKVKTIHVEEGMTLKRFTARAKGRGNRILKPTCHVYVTVGEVGNEEHGLRKIGTAGANRGRGIRPTVRGVAMNPVDHPHGGGEGRTGEAREPVSPWGPPAKGYRTRSNKRTDGMIVQRRHKR